MANRVTYQPNASVVKNHLAVATTAPGNGQSFGGIKVSSDNGWFAARPSGTEEIYKIYAESFLGDAHLKRLLDEAQALVDKAIAS